MTRMKCLAQELVFWPGMCKDIQHFVETCNPCREVLPSQTHEPLLSESASYPMEKLACDLFTWNGNEYLTVADRYSGFIWCHKLWNTRTETIAKLLLRTFEDFGYPTSIQPDNGPQFREPFKVFCKAYGISHVPSSAYNPPSNGLAESAVKICKTLLQKSDEDCHIFLNCIKWLATCTKTTL